MNPTWRIGGLVLAAAAHAWPSWPTTRWRSWTSRPTAITAWGGARGNQLVIRIGGQAPETITALLPAGNRVVIHTVTYVKSQ